MWWNSSLELEPGNTDNSPFVIEWTNPLDLTKPEDWDTKLNKDLLSIELESEEEEEKIPFPKVLFTENPNLKELTTLNPLEISDLLLKKELVDKLDLLEFWTHIGSLKMEPINFMKSFWLTQDTMLLETILESTGSANPSINIENSEETPQLEDHPEDSEPEETKKIKLDHQEDKITKEETKFLLEDTDDLTFFYLYFVLKH